MDKNKHTAILLATYNGENFIKEQLNSLYSQTCKDWTLYVHDDGSTDNTATVLREFSLGNSNMTIMDYPKMGNPKDNFMSMLEKVDADYYLFCDQDDRWVSDKIEKEMNHIHLLEEKNPGKPVLVFSDLYVADRRLNILSNSMWEHGGIRPELLKDFSLGGAFQYVTGCTMMFNRKAKECIIYPAPKATMHDTWAVLCILRQGGIVSAVYKPLVYYRQHGDNTLGASNRSHRRLIHKLRNIRHIWYHDRNHWEMLKELGYGSFAKFLYYKYLIIPKYFINIKLFS